MHEEHVSSHFPGCFLSTLLWVVHSEDELKSLSPHLIKAIFTPAESKPPAWFKWHLLRWSNKLNIYDIQEIRAWGKSLCKDQWSLWGQSQRREPAAFIVPSLGASLGQTHNFPAQHEWRWIEAGCSRSEGLRSRSHSEFSAGSSGFPSHLNCCQRGTEISSLWKHHRSLFCFLSSFCSPGKRSPALWNDPCSLPCLLHRSTEQPSWDNFLSGLDSLNASVVYPIKAKPLLGLLQQRITVIYSECFLQNLNKCNFQAPAEMQVDW